MPHFIVSPAANHARSNRGRSARGFTLVEILTATAIMSVIISMVLTILTQVLNAWSTSSDAMTLGSQARTALDDITQNLQYAIFKRDGNQWLGLTTEVLTAAPTFPPTESRLMFFAPTIVHETKDINGSPIYGDVCAIEYRVDYGDPFVGGSSDPTNHPPTFSLHRCVINPHSTLNGSFGNGPVMGATNLLTLWEQVDNAGPSNVAKDLNNNGLTVYGSKMPGSSLADNVAQFEVRLYYYFKDPNSSLGANAPTIVLPMPTYTPAANPNYPLLNAFYGGDNNGTVPYNLNNLANLINTNVLPLAVPGFVGLAYADITLTILTDEGVAKYQANQLQGLDWFAFIQQYGHSFSTRVAFLNQPQ